MSESDQLAFERNMVQNTLLKAIKQGFKETEIRNLDAIKQLRNQRKFKYYKLILIAISVVIFGIILYDFELLNFLFFAQGFFLRNQASAKTKCVYELNDSLKSLVQLKSDSCKFCKDVESVDKMSDLKPEFFEKWYAYNGIPVVVTDGMKNWTAQKTFDYDYFKDLYSKSDLSSKDCQFLAYKSGFNDMYEFLNMDENRAKMDEGTKPWYVGWSNCDANATRKIRRHYDRPYFLPRTSESKTVDWIFMGSPGYGAQMHVDHVNYPSWQAQLTGTKLWTLLPPPECNVVCRKVDVVVESGEIIVLDTNKWFHKTQILGKEMSITIGAEYD